jgi:chromosome segregation ATPase
VLEIEVTQKQKELEGIVRGINTSENASAEKTEKLDKKRKEAEETIKNLVEKRLSLEKERKDHIDKIEESDKKLKKIEESGKKRIREFQKEIREWKKAKEKLQEKIVSVEKKKEPLFEGLGRQADEARLDQEELTVFFSQIDRSNERIKELEEQIHNL